jgi:hypothetical protein
MNISPPIYSGSYGDLDPMEPIATVMQNMMIPNGHGHIEYREVHPLLLMSPSVASGLVSKGWDKDRIRRYLFENLKMEARWMELVARHGAGGDFASPEADAYAQRWDPHELLPLLIREEWTDIVIGGDPQRNQSRAYVSNNMQGPPVTKRVILPQRWPKR